MKKIFSLLLMGMMLTGMTSCLDSNENNETSFSVGMYQRVVTDGSGDVADFFTNNYYFTINSSDFTVNIDVTSTYEEGNTLSFSTGKMNFSVDREMQAYRFSSPNITTQGHTVSNFKGMIDLSSGVAYISFMVDGDKTVYATAHLPFMFNSTHFIPEDGSAESDSEKLQYDFTINKSKMTATVLILNFVPEEDDKDSGTKVAVFEGLDLKITRDGYEISAESVKSSISGKGNIKDAELKDVKFNITAQGTRFNGAYSTNTYKATVSGKMFNEQK